MYQSIIYLSQLLRYRDIFHTHWLTSNRVGAKALHIHPRCVPDFASGIIPWREPAGNHFQDMVWDFRAMVLKQPCIQAGESSNVIRTYSVSGEQLWQCGICDWSTSYFFRCCTACSQIEGESFSSGQRSVQLRNIVKNQGPASPRSLMLLQIPSSLTRQDSCKRKTKNHSIVSSVSLNHSL